jgi:hypothetical protein
MIDGNILTSIFRSAKAPPKHWQGASERLAGVPTIVYKKPVILLNQALSLA